jgi:hypothetical protein
MFQSFPSASSALGQRSRPNQCQQASGYASLGSARHDDRAGRPRTTQGATLLLTFVPRKSTEDAQKLCNAKSAVEADNVPGWISSSGVHTRAPDHCRRIRSNWWAGPFACADSARMGRTTLLAKLASDSKNCKWIYRFPANPGMPKSSIVLPTPVLAPVSALGACLRIALSSSQVPLAPNKRDILSEAITSRHNCDRYVYMFLRRSGRRGPGLHRSLVATAHLRSPLEGPRGSGHPDPDFMLQLGQHSRQPCSRSTNRKKAPCQGFQESNR